MTILNLNGVPPFDFMVNGLIYILIFTALIVASIPLVNFVINLLLDKFHKFIDILIDYKLNVRSIDGGKK